MKNSVYTLFWILFPICVLAQNRIGINTSSPTALFEIEHPSLSELLLHSDGYTADTSRLILKNMNTNGTGTEYIFESINELGLALRSNSDLVANQNDLIYFKPQGQIGLGTTQPSNYLTLQHTETSGTYGIDIINNGTGNAGIFLRATNWYGLVLENNMQKLRLGRGASANDINGIVIDDQNNVAIGHDNPLSDLHIVGSATEGQVMIGPDANVNQDSEIFLAEDNQGTNGIKLHYNGASNRLEFKGYSNNSDKGPHFVMNRENGNIGMGGIINPQSQLHVAGDVRITDLVGIGNRNVLTDNNGKLIVGPPTANTRIYSINPAAFHCALSGGNASYQATGFSAAGTYSGNNCSSHGIVAPLQLEHGDQINKMTLHYQDFMSDRDIVFALIKLAHGAIGGNTVAYFRTNGDFGNDIISSVDNFTTETIDNLQYSYFMSIAVETSSGSIPWPDSGAKIYSIIIE